MEWHYEQNNQPIGPVNEAQIKELIENGAIKIDTQVWNDGMEDWAAVSKTELKELLPVTPPPLKESSPQMNTPHGNTKRMIQPRTLPSSVGWMTFWGLIWPGLGQLLCGQGSKGAVLMIASSFLHIMTGGVLSILLCIIGAIDANMVARRLAIGKAVGEWEFFPKISP